ncbi:MAG: cytochrome c [Sulfurimonas sp.]|jgi:cytochrome c|nr:cytochrome c [Sulfurimonadaceae bacterium]
MKKNILLALVLVAILAGCSDSDTKGSEQVATKSVTKNDSAKESLKATVDEVASTSKSIVEDAAKVANEVVDEMVEVSQNAAEEATKIANEVAETSQNVVVDVLKTANDVLGDTTQATQNIVEDSTKVADEAKSEVKSAINVASTLKACVGCHGLDGSKNTMVAGDGIPNTMSKAELKDSLNGYASGSLNKFGKGALMVSFAKNLTPEQIDAIAEAWGK